MHEIFLPERMYYYPTFFLSINRTGLNVMSRSGSGLCRIKKLKCNTGVFILLSEEHILLVKWNVFMHSPENQRKAMSHMYWITSLAKIIIWFSVLFLFERKTFNFDPFLFRNETLTDFIFWLRSNWGKGYRKKIEEFYCFTPKEKAFSLLIPCFW